MLKYLYQLFKVFLYEETRLPSRIRQAFNSYVFSHIRFVDINCPFFSIHKLNIEEVNNVFSPLLIIQSNTLFFFEY